MEMCDLREKVVSSDEPIQRIFVKEKREKREIIKTVD